MRKYRISVQVAQKCLTAALERIPQYATLLVEFVREHPGEIITSTGSVVFAFDNWRVRRQLKKERQENEKDNALRTEAIRKQDAEIEVLKDEAKRTHALIAIVKQLYMAEQEGDIRHEETQKVGDKAADR